MMVLNCLTLLSVVLSVTLSLGFSIFTLDDSQSLRFDEIGKLKLIKSHKIVQFVINLQTLGESIQNATEHLELVKELFANNIRAERKLNNIKMVLDYKKMEFDDEIHEFSKNGQNELSRKKRACLFGMLMCADDAEKIAVDLEAHRDKTNAIVNTSNDIRAVAHNTSTLLQKTKEAIAKQSALMYLEEEKDDIVRVVDGLIKILTDKRLNIEIIPIDVLDRTIKRIEIAEDEALPYIDLLSYYKNLPVNYKVVQNSFEIEVEIPIIEKYPRKLFKIVEIPARVDGNIVMTNVIWKYIAVNDNETTTFVTLNPCFKHQYDEAMFYCKHQSPVKNKDAKDCLNNFLNGNETVDLNLCKHSIVQPTSLMLIKLNKGEYFYYTPKNENSTVTCGVETHDKVLVEGSSGIIKLEPECFGVTSNSEWITG